MKQKTVCMTLKFTSPAEAQKFFTAGYALAGIKFKMGKKTLKFEWIEMSGDSIKLCMAGHAGIFLTAVQSIVRVTGSESPQISLA